MDASQNPLLDSIAIDLPEISKLLIIGDSETAFEFSKNLQNIALFEQIYHVESIFSAVKLLNRARFGVIVIDADAKFDVVSCSKVINLSNELTRILLISQNLTASDAVTLKNKGFIHAYIPIPNQDMLVHSLIVKEQASYRIQKSLIDMIINPPLNTPLYNLVKQQTPISHNRSYRILGVVIMQDTIVKYNLFFGYDESVDPYLLSSYLSAISMYGKNIFDVKVGEFEGLLFESVSILMKSFEDFQYVYMVENLAESKLSELEKLLTQTTRKIHVKFSHILDKTMIRSQEDLDRMSLEIKKILKMEYKPQDVLEYDNKPIIINVDLPNDLLSQLEEETERVYRIEQVASEYQLLDMIEETECDVVILNDVQKLEDQKSTISNIKSISPSSQIIISTENVNNEFIFELLNQDEVDFILTPDMTLDEYFALVKKAIDHSRKIKRGASVEDLYEFHVSTNKTAMVKTLLSKIPHSLDKMTLPILYGVFIMDKGSKFYSNYWVQDEDAIIQNEESFLSFMQALLIFSKDYGKSSVALSLVNFGASKLVVDKEEDYWYIYFIGDLDISNYDFVKEKTRGLTIKINDAIMTNFDSKTEYTNEELKEKMDILDKEVDELCTKMMIEISMA